MKITSSFLAAAIALYRVAAVARAAPVPFDAELQERFVDASPVFASATMLSARDPIPVDLPRPQKPPSVKEILRNLEAAKTASQPTAPPLKADYARPINDRAGFFGETIYRVKPPSVSDLIDRFGGPAANVKPAGPTPKAKEVKVEGLHIQKARFGLKKTANPLPKIKEVQTVKDPWLDSRLKLKKVVRPQNQLEALKDLAESSNANSRLGLKQVEPNVDLGKELDGIATKAAGGLDGLSFPSVQNLKTLFGHA